MIRFLFIFISLFSIPAFAQDSVWTLKECIEHGLTNNLLIRQDVLSNEHNAVAVAQSRSGRIPVVGASASHNYSFGRSIDPFTNEFVNRNIRSNNFSISGSLVLFNGFQNTNQIKVNEMLYQAGELDIQASRNNLILSISQNYYQILNAREQIELARRRLESTEAQLENIRKRVEAGTVAEINLLQMQAQLANDRVTVANAENQLYLSRVNLMQLLDIPLSQEFEIMGTDAEELFSHTVPEGTPAEVFEEALQVQPAIQSLALRKSSSELNLRSARLSRLPRLSMSGNVFTGYSSARFLTSVHTQVIETNIGYLENDPAQLVNALTTVNHTVRGDYPFGRQLRDNISQSLGFNLSVPILSNRQVRSNIERAEINLRLAELNEQNGRNQMRKNIEQAYVDMISAANIYEAAGQSLEMLEQAYRNAERRFGLGLLSPADFLIESNNYYQARASYAQAKYQYALMSRILDFYKDGEFLTR